MPTTSNQPFYGERLRLARLLSTMSLEDVGEQVGATRQFLHQLETDQKSPTPEMQGALEQVLDVQSTFFSIKPTAGVSEADCHFRRLQTASRSAILQTIARGSFVEQLSAALEKTVRLPKVDFPLLGVPGSLAEVEEIAAEARAYWHLGDDAPISNVTRVLERAGAIVINFPDISERVDALSMSRRRPIVVRSSVKSAAARVRFDLSHECAHLIMHSGCATGDHETEEQAHRFASAFLFPAKSMLREFPRSSRLDWVTIFQLKLRWGMSLRAIIRRGYDLGMLDAVQYRSANIHLMKTGQSKVERGDGEMNPEQPELLTNALSSLASRDLQAYYSLIRELGVTSKLFSKLLDMNIPPIVENVSFLRRKELLPDQA